MLNISIPVKEIFRLSFSNVPYSGICEYDGKEYYYGPYMDYGYQYVNNSRDIVKGYKRIFYALEVSKFVLWYLRNLHKILQIFNQVIVFEPKGKFKFLFYSEKDAASKKLMIGKILTPAGIFTIKKNK